MVLEKNIEQTTPAIDVCDSPGIVVVVNDGLSDSCVTDFPNECSGFLRCLDVPPAFRFGC
jgi:hypothetical protein